MAPEQFLGQATDPRTDQFSFCVALYEGLYGERPFAGNSLQQVEANVLAGEVVAAPAKNDVPSWFQVGRPVPWPPKAIEYESVREHADSQTLASRRSIVGAQRFAARIAPQGG